jgi:hypothetical protein
MAFPQITYETRYGAEISNNTSHSISLPTDMVEGDLILVLFAVDASETLTINTGISGNNWNVAGSQATTPITAGVFWKIAEGEGYDYLQIDTTSEAASYISYGITGFYVADPIDISSVGTGSSTNMDPPSLTPSYDTRDYLWIVFGAMDGIVYATQAPNDFSDLVVGNNSYEDGCTCSSATREYRYGSAYNPGTFTNNSGDWITYTIIINPTSVVGVEFTNFFYNK